MEYIEILKKDLKDIIKISFQPIYCLKEKKIVTHEVLSRFHSEKVGIIETLKVIEALEKIGEIHNLDFIIIEKIKDYVVEKDMNICINLSPKTILRDDFLEKLSILEKGYKNLEVEITERGSFNYNQLLKRILYLKKLGIKITMDDFPIGNSNLENLLKMHVDGVKIDRELLKNLCSDKGKGIYKSVVNLLKNIENEITAEGIETEEELEFVKSLGIDKVQGYYISKPILEEDFKKI